MARPIKAGLDYFELDCQMEDKIKLIQAEYGLKGFAVIVKLYQKIYGTYGYYCEWNDDVSLLFALQECGSNGDENNLINEIVKACIRRGIFSEELFRKYRILTSAGIQTRYLSATSKREMVELKKEYLLVSVDKNRVNVVINSVSDGRNLVSDTRNTQRRVEKSREEKSREEKKKKAPPPIVGLSVKEAIAIVESCGFSSDLKDSVKEWIRYKTERRQPYKQIGLKHLLETIRDNAERYGDRPVVNCINQSITNNWQGLFFDKITERGNEDSRLQSDRGAEALFHMMKEGVFDE